MWDRLGRWVTEVLRQLQRNWWVWAVLLFSRLVEDRFLNGVNSVLDSLGLAFWPSTKAFLAWLGPFGVSGLLFVIVVGVILILAYFDTRHAVSTPKLARTDESQFKPNPERPISEEHRNQAIAEFRENLEKRAALNRQIFGGENILKPPVPPLIGFSLSPVENIRISDPKLSINIENKTTEPMYEFELWVNAVQFWSTAQEAFVNHSSLNRRFLLGAPKILEPDSPTRVFLLTKASNGCLLIAEREVIGEVGGMWLRMPGIYRIELLIKIKGPAQTRHDLFIVYEPEKVPQFVSDPRLK